MAGNEGQTTQSNNAAAENFSIRVTALSPLHLGSGKGDVTIDAEVVHDAVGLPYFPAKRLKGLLYESALEVVEIMDADPIFSADEVKALFRHGTKTRTGAQLIVSNLHLENYETMRREWSFLEDRYPELIQPRDVLEQYTSLRYQTKIDANTRMAADTSLHNMRVVDKNVVFTGTLSLLQAEDTDRLILAFAVRNLERAGLKRNRGFGRIRCELQDPNGADAGAAFIEKALDTWKEGGC